MHDSFIINCRTLRNIELTSVRVEDLVNYTSLEILSVEIIMASYDFSSQMGDLCTQT